MEKLGKISLAINGLLVVAIIFLFTKNSGLEQKFTTLKGEVKSSQIDSTKVLNWVNGPTQAADTIDLSMADSTLLDFPIAYIDYQYLVENYKFVAKIQKDLENSAKSKERSLLNETQKLQKDFEKTQKEYEAGILSPEDAQAKQQEFAQREQELLMKKQKYQGDLAQQEYNLINKLTLNISNYLQDNSEKFKYSYVIMKGTPSSPVAYANEGLDITKPLVAALNKTYDKEYKK